MKSVFMDTLYLVARLNPRDQWHERAHLLSTEFSDARLVTTESILLEVLNFFAAYRSEMRQTVASVCTGGARGFERRSDPAYT
jgi:predicted nucleic acid-binding protein